jgi:uncharacterized Fe-S center protein
VSHCPVGAIRVAEGKAAIDPEACIGCADCIVVCPEKTIHVDWNEVSPVVQRKMVDHALGAVAGKNGALLFVSFVTQVSPFCDCYPFNDRPMAPDVGILASADPVALDQACADLVIEAAGKDPFRRPIRRNCDGAALLRERSAWERVHRLRRCTRAALPQPR